MYAVDQKQPTKLEKQSKIINSAVLFLSNSCDGAHTTDGIGFNKIDNDYGHNLAHAIQKHGRLTPRQQYEAWKLCRKYWRQLRKSEPEIILPKKWVNTYRLDGMQIWNESKGTGPYLLEWIGDGELSCTCEAYSNGNDCAHIDYAIAQGLGEDTACEAKIETAELIKEVESGQTDYEMLPGVFANEGQLAALNNLKKFALGESVMYLLTGFSGTGKTTLVQAWLKDLRESGYQGRVVFTAPTNKAANVLQRMVNKWGLDVGCLTCAKLLGLKPVIDFETGRQRFKKSYGDESVIQDYDLVVIDETSMVNRELWRYLAEEANMFTRLLFTGDPAQLPPVNEAISESFLEIEDSSHLSEVMRYRGSIAAMADDIRRNLGRRGEPFFETQYNEDGSEGLFVLTQASWNDNIIKAFESEKYLQDPDYCRVLAYTNKRVNTINTMVRAAIRGKEAPRFVKGERLIATDHYSIANQFGGSTTVLNTSSEMEVSGVSAGMDGRWKVWFLDVTLFDDGRSWLIPVLHGECAQEFERTQKELKQKAQNGDKQLWRQWHENRSRFAYVDYAYAITTHKAQGSTFTNVFVDVTNVLSNKRKNLVQMPGEDKKRWVYERNQLLYVAMTRPAKRLFIVE